jgi:hypothetical protein
MSYTSLEDALDAVDRVEAIHNLDDSFNLTTIKTFLNSLKSKQEPLVIASDYDGFILEGAMQRGFEFINDDADLYVVSGAKLIEFVKLQRTPQ